MAFVGRPCHRGRTGRLALVTGLTLIACSGIACSGPAGSRPSELGTDSPSAPPVRLVFLGDVMLGRDVGVVAASDPQSIFERLRPALIDADLVLANLESPLTTRAHTAPGFALEADPAVAPLLAAAGIDVVDLANNHATDAGRDTVLDTISATSKAGVRTVGAGADRRSAAAPLIIDVGDVRVGILAYDLAGGDPATADAPGVNPWSPADAERAVRALRTEADLVVVGLHGGVEYLPKPDPVLQRVTDELTDWGADIVWGHGAHVAYAVTVTDGARPAVRAPGLGNALFDQALPGTDSGALLEVLADATGVLAARTGRIDIEAGRSAFAGWDDPDGDAVSLRTEWWTPVRPLVAQPTEGCSGLDLGVILGRLPEGSAAVANDCGQVTGTGTTEMVIAYRRPMSTEVLQRAFPGRRWADAAGMSAHLAVMEPDGRMRWGAATLLDPIGAVAVCSQSAAVGFTTLDDPTIVAAGAWHWKGFGFRTAPALARPTFIGCADVDRDGTTEPFVQRSATP